MWRGAGICLLLSLCRTAALSQDDSKVPVFGTTVVVNSGLRGEIYFLHHWAKRLPNFAHMTPHGTIYTSELNVAPQDFKLGFPGISKRNEWFAIDYTGRFWVSKPGLYRFSLSSDDGSKLYIDDRLIIDNDGIHPPQTKFGGTDLATGVHSIRLSYFQGPRFQVALLLKVSNPGETKFEIFDTDHFKPPSNVYESPVKLRK
jgi:hypothetical protein